MSVNTNKIPFPEANVIPIAGEKNIYLYYSPVKPVLVYAWKDGIRLQIAIKSFERNGTKEKCILMAKPRDVNVKETVEKTLRALKEAGAIKGTTAEEEAIVKRAAWGLAGNFWIEVKGGRVNVVGVRSCSKIPVYIFQGEWKSVEETKSLQLPLPIVLGFIIVIFVVLALRRR